MVVIRLARVGKKNSPAFRVVVADKQRSAKRKFIEVIGHYNPAQDPKVIEIDEDRANFWMDKGAQPSDTVRNLMAGLGILKKSEKVDIRYAKDKEDENKDSEETVNKEEEKNTGDAKKSEESTDKAAEKEQKEEEKEEDPEDKKEDKKDK